MICHHGGIQSTPFWAPPGGGLDYNETVYDALKREFLEETGLQVRVDEFLYINEFLRPPLHAIELFFKVTPLTEEIHLGNDPELSLENQMLTDLRWMYFEEIKALPSSEIHTIFHLCQSKEDLYEKKGFLDYSI